MPVSHRARWAALLCALACAACGHSLGNAVTGRGGDTCLRRDDIIDRVAVVLGHDSIDPSLSIVLDAEEGDPARASFTVRRGEHVIAERTLDGLTGSCQEKVNAVSLAMAVAILLERLEPTPERYSAVAAPLFVSGLLGGNGGGARLAMEARPWAHVRLSAGALFVSEREVTLGPGKAGLGLIAGQAEACAVQSVGVVDPSVCVGGSLGRLGAAGRGFKDSFADALLWSAASARIELRFRVARALALTLEGGVHVPLGDRTLVVEDEEGLTIAESTLPRVGATAGIGVVVYLW